MTGVAILYKTDEQNQFPILNRLLGFTYRERVAATVKFTRRIIYKSYTKNKYCMSFRSSDMYECVTYLNNWWNNHRI